MTISIVSSASDEANTITLPTHAAGDTIIIFASRLSSNAGITESDTALALALTNAAQGQRHVFYRKIAQSGSETVGTFTNAEIVVALILRSDVSGALVFSNNTANAATNLTTVRFSAIALAGVALDQRVIGYAGAKNTAATIGTAPTGMTNILTGTVTGEGVVGLHATDSGATSQSTQTATIHGSNVASASITLDVFEAVVPSSGGGAAFQLVGGGGLVY